MRELLPSGCIVADSRCSRAKLQPAITLPCLLLYPLLRFVGSKLKFKQEGAIASLSTAAAISILVVALKGLEPGILACIMLAIILIRHTPNLREMFSY